jgi:mono/diheme cytochrome c family protein
VRKALSISFIGGLAALLAVMVALPADAKTVSQQSDPVARGKYLATISGCGGCHTPFKPDGTPDESKAFAGGYEFDLGPLGKIHSSNLTSDKDTGLGNWTDAQIKLALQTGVRPTGEHLFPIMPYTYFNSMASGDLDDIIAYLRTLPAISNKVDFKQVLPTEALPQLTARNDIVAPAPTDTEARGKYLFNAVIACSDCHTPVDQQTGKSMIDTKYLAGGQPYEGPWGIVYSANLTPDMETGIGKLTDDDIARVFHQGVLPEGRRVVLMPWQDFQTITDDDLSAMIYYLRNDVKPVNNAVPANALNPQFVQYVPITKPATGPSVGQIALTVVGGLVVVLGVALMIIMGRRSNKTGVK